jgi:hypothetical protein
MITLVLKYLLIVLVAAPVIAISTALFFNLTKFVNIKNREDKAVKNK